MNSEPHGQAETFLHISYQSLSTHFVLRLQAHIQRLNDHELRERSAASWHAGEPLAELALSVTTRLQLVEICRSRCEHHLQVLSEEIEARAVEIAGLVRAGCAIQLRNELCALEIILDFDSFIIELNSACELILKFTAEYRRSITGKEPAKQPFEKLLSSAGIPKAWYENLAKRHRNVIVHELTPWPVIEVIDLASGKYDLALLKTNAISPTFADCIRIGVFRDIYAGYRDSLDRLHQLLINEATLADKFGVTADPGPTT